MIEVLPGMVVDHKMYEAAAEGVRTYAPEVSLPWERFTDPREWALIPDECTRVVKAEMVLSDWPALTRKINRWFSPDLRGGEKPKPHSHPWRFTSRILCGGYTEDRYDITGDQLRTEFNVEHMFGTANEVPKELFHEVTEIHEPGATLTLMVCDRGTKGAWGYLDVDTGQYMQTKPDPEFSARWRALNSHLS